MNALELADELDHASDLGEFKHYEAAEMLRRQHEELQQLKDRLEAAEKALAEPAAEPVMWAWQRDDGSWYDASATHHSRGMKPLYASPPPAEPAVEPFGYFRAEPFGWTDCAPTDEGAKALYEVPPPAEVPMISDDEIFEIITNHTRNARTDIDRVVRGVEAAVRRKAGL